MFASVLFGVSFTSRRDDLFAFCATRPIASGGWNRFPSLRVLGAFRSLLRRSDSCVAPSRFFIRHEMAMEIGMALLEIELFDASVWGWFSNQRIGFVRRQKRAFF